jgi:GDP-D-mannose dehydratase
MATYQNELSVITKSKDLCSYIITVTDKSPKRFRFTLVSKLQNYAISVIENLFRANEVFVKQGDIAKAEQRLEYQRQAMTELKLLSYISQLAMQQQCITAQVHPRFWEPDDSTLKTAAKLYCKVQNKHKF